MRRYDNIQTRRLLNRFRPGVEKVHRPRAATGGDPSLLCSALLDELASAGIEFIVVGRAAGVIYGAPATTKDLDLVHRRSPETIARLMRVLGDIGAHFWPDPAQRRLPPPGARPRSGSQPSARPGLSTPSGPPRLWPLRVPRSQQPTPPAGKRTRGRRYQGSRRCWRRW